MIDRSARVLVTGAGGLIGAHVVGELAAAGYEPIAFVHDASSSSALEIRGDVRDLASLTAAIEGCQAVVHSAALYSYSRADAARMRAVNLEGTRNVLEAAARAGVRRVVVTSSAGTCGPVLGRPASEADEAPAWELAVPYKATKLAAERLALERAAEGHDVVVVNPTTTVGPRDRRPTPSGRMVSDVLSGRIRGYISSGGLNLVAARDVARGHVLALERGRRGERYLLGGDNLAMSELFALIARLGGVARPRLGVPYRIALGAAWLLDLAGRWIGREPSLLMLDEVRLARLPMYFTSAKAQNELGYTYRPAAEALAETVAWFRNAARPEPRRAGVHRARRGFAT